jgi:hypothetical protein
MYRANTYASSRTHSSALRWAVLAVGLLIEAMPACDANGQTTEAVTAPSANAVTEAELMVLRQQLDETTRTVREQRTLLEQQAARFDALERQLPVAAEDSPRPQVASDHASLTMPADILQPDSTCDCFPLLTIGGQYRLMFNSSNYDFHQTSISHQQETATFLELLAAHQPPWPKRRERPGGEPSKPQLRPVHRSSEIRIPCVGSAVRPIRLRMVPLRHP